MSSVIEFPPLLTGIAVPADPWEVALAGARADVDPGTVFYGIDEATLRVAILLAPEEPLQDAIRASFAVSLGFNDALGALGPPEVALHLVWPNGIKVNGAHCGHMRAAANTDDPEAEPDWMVLALDVPVIAETDGSNPEETALHNEGCGEVMIPDLIEAWGRHMMNWLHIYLTDGFEPLHREWLQKADGREEGTFLGLDERGGLLLKDDKGTRILPLTDLLEKT